VWGSSKISWQAYDNEYADAQEHVLLDVRDEHEWDGGHARGAVHISLTELSSRIDEAAPDKMQLIITYCTVGPRAAEAEKKLRGMGYENVMYISGDPGRRLSFMD